MTERLYIQNSKPRDDHDDYYCDYDDHDGRRCISGYPGRKKKKKKRLRV